MRHTTSMLKNEQGAVVIMAAVMILVLLTIIGIASVNISNTEVQIAGQESTYQQNFYNAEGATLETIELMESIANPKTAGLSWLEPNIDVVTGDDIFDSAFWQAGNGTVTPQLSSTLDDTQFLAVSEGVMSGGSGTSLAMGRSKVENVVRSGADVVVSPDISCLMHVGGILRRDPKTKHIRAMHIAELLVSKE